MKTAARDPLLEATSVEKKSRSLSVCMHVLGPARTDVRVMREATALAEEGYRVTVVDLESENVGQVDEVYKGIRLRHIEVSHTFSTTRFTKWRLLRAASLLLRGVFSLLRTPADVYHAHDVSGLPACYIVACLRRRPLIFDAHELPLDDMSFRSPFIQGVLRALLRHVAPRCAGVITVSPPIAREIQRDYRPSSVTLVRNVAPYRVVSRSDRLRQLLHLSSEKRIALYQGHLEVDRGLDMLVRAARFLDENCVMVFMGRGRHGVKEQLEILIADEGMQDRVRIVPPVPYEELLDWTASADIGLIIYEPERSLNIRMCLPNKIFEYLMAGLPVLSSRLDAVGEIIQERAVGRIVSSLAPEEVGTALRAMLTDDAALATMRDNALEAARQFFCWEKEREELLALYEGL